VIASYFVKLTVKVPTVALAGAPIRKERAETEELKSRLGGLKKRLGLSEPSVTVTGSRLREVMSNVMGLLQVPALITTLVELISTGWKRPVENTSLEAGLMIPKLLVVTRDVVKST
jgi:hypothetical protein